MKSTTIATLLVLLLLFTIPTFAETSTRGSGSGHSDGAESIYPYWGLFSGGACSIGGYDKCWQAEGGYKMNCALAQYLAKQAYSLPERKYCPNLGWYVLDEYKIKYKCVGDKSYNLLGASKPYCNKDGCSATQTPLEGYFTVSNKVGNVKDKSIILLCHDYDYDSCGGYWVYSWGYVYYTIKLGNDYILKCCTNEDCGTGMLCDKTGDYTKWHCKADPCYKITCEDYCAGTVKYTNGKCVDGNCQYTETKAKSHCMNNVAYYNGYCVNGEIDYKSKVCEDYCTGSTLFNSACKDGACIITQIPAKDYCIENERYYNGVCKGNKLSYQTEHCPFGCTNGICHKTVQPLEPDIESFTQRLINSIKIRLAEFWGLVLEMINR